MVELVYEINMRALNRFAIVMRDIIDILQV
jgi:hypothetical protein